MSIRCVFRNHPGAAAMWPDQAVAVPVLALSVSTSELYNDVPAYLYPAHFSSSQSDTEPHTSHKMIFTSLLLTLAATAQAGNIAEELTKMGATTLVDLVVKAGLADTLSNSGPFTVFAPDNDAFSRVPQSIMDALASDVELLKKVLLYHVVSGDIRSSAAENNVKLDSVQGAPILVNLYLKSEYYDVSF